MRPLGGRLDESEMLGSTPYTYYGGKGPPRDALPDTYTRPVLGAEGAGLIPDALGRPRNLHLPFYSRRSYTTRDAP